MNRLVTQSTRLLMALCVMAFSPVGWSNPLTAAALTSAAGFRVVVVPGDAPDAMLRNRGIADQVVTVASTPFRVTVPADAFAHTNRNAVVNLRATQANGQPLPAWLSFDAMTGTFFGRVAPGERRNLQIQVTAKDDGGRVASETFLIAVGSVRR